MIKCEAQHATKLHIGRKAGSAGKLMSTRALTSTLRSPFTMYTANQPSGLQYSCSLQRISPRTGVKYPIHWCGDQHELLATLLHRSDSVLTHHNYLLGVCS